MPVREVRGKPPPGPENPLIAFHRLFSNETVPLTKRRAMLVQMRSVLDAALADAGSLRRGLNKTDADQLDEYFQSV